MVWNTDTGFMDELKTTKSLAATSPPLLFSGSFTKTQYRLSIFEKKYFSLMATLELIH